MAPSLSGSDLGLGERGYKTVECKLIGPFLLIIGFIFGKRILCDLLLLTLFRELNVTTVQYSCPWRGAWCSASRGSPSPSTAPVCLPAGKMPTEYHTNNYKYLFQHLFSKIL